MKNQLLNANDIIKTRQKLAEIGIQEIKRVGIKFEDLDFPDYFISFNPAKQLLSKHFEPALSVVRFLLKNRIEKKSSKQWLENTFLFNLQNAAVGSFEKYPNFDRGRPLLLFKKTTSSSLSMEEIFEDALSKQPSYKADKIYSGEQFKDHKISVTFQTSLENFVPTINDLNSLNVSVTSMEDIVNRSIIIYHPLYINETTKQYSNSIFDMLLPAEAAMFPHLLASINNECAKERIRMSEIFKHKLNDRIKYKEILKSRFQGGVRI